MSKRTFIFLVNLTISLALVIGIIYVFIFAVPTVAALYADLGSTASNFWFTFSEAIRNLWFLVIPVLALLLFGASYLGALVISRLHRKNLVILYAVVLLLLLLLCGTFYAVIVLIPTYSIGNTI